MKRLLLFCVFSLCVFSLKAQKIPASTSNTVYTVNTGLDQLPQFPGGLDELNKFLIKNLKWPSQDDVQGRVYINFIVEKDGRLTNFKIERKLRPEFDKEALRVLKKMPRWKPATVNGKPVKCRDTVPINFMFSG